MLQFIAEHSDKYTIAEQITMAIEGGCAWVQLRVPDLNESQILSLLEEIVPICRETETFLTIEDQPEIAKKAGIHGVHITKSGVDARQLRADLGAEAIIGINVVAPQGVPTLEKLDIDYVTIAPEISLDEAKSIIDIVRSVDCKIPIVITGDFNCFDIAAIRATGASGVATGKKLMAAANPAEATSQLLIALKQ